MSDRISNGMSDPIPRAEALRLIEEAAYKAENTHSLAIAYGHRLASDVVRAIPAIGTCATCAEWLAVMWNEREGHMCDAFGGVGHETPPDHSCASYRRREE